jgi:hypothetical protein
MGQVGDPILEALQKQFPNVKTKGDLLANPQALGAARKLFETNLAEPDEETGLPSSAAPAAPTAPSAPKPVYDQATGKLKGYYYPDRGYVPNAQ